jgi:hypothetical protein
MNVVQDKMEYSMPMKKKIVNIMTKRLGSNNRPVVRMGQNQKPMMKRMGM